MKETAEQRMALVDLGAQVRAAAANADSSGHFEGLACKYGVKDTYGTTFEPGCFSAGTPDLGVRFPFLAMHKPDKVLGTFTAEERADGLYIVGDYDSDAESQTYRGKAISGSMPGLSVGFVRLVDPESPDWESITHARLVEVSQITLGMQAVPGSELTAVRSAIRSDDSPKTRCADCGRFATAEHDCPQATETESTDAERMTVADELLVYRVQTA